MQTATNRSPPRCSDGRPLVVVQSPGAAWRSHPIFAAAGQQRCDALARANPARRYEPDEVIASAGDPVEALGVLLEGTVELCCPAGDGSELTARLLAAPNLIGDCELLQRLPLLASVRAVGRVSLATVARADYLRLLAENPPVMMAHLRHLAAALCVSTRSQRQIVAPLEVRLANLLLSYADLPAALVRSGQDAGEGATTIDHPLSQRVIARGLGATRRAVATILSGWRKAGTVVKRGPRYAICDRSVLEQLAAPLRCSLVHRTGMTFEPFVAERERAAVEVDVRVVNGARPVAGLRRPVVGELLVGRGADCGLQLPDETVSPRHCRVFLARTGGRYWVEDLGSLNGTFLNGRQVRRAVVRDGDLLQVGYTRMAVGQRLVGQTLARLR